MLNVNDELEIEITALGGMGDGIGRYDNQVVFVPLTCVGEVVRAKVESVSAQSARARLVSLGSPGPHRAEPACEHFGLCGGCSLQHMDTESYYEFKRREMQQLVQRLGYEPDALRETVRVGEGGRRRAEFQLRVTKGRVEVGFFASKSHELVDVRMCPVMTPEMAGLVAPLREALTSLKKPGLVSAISVTHVAEGFDALLTLKAALPAGDREKLSAFGRAHRILRLAAALPEEPPHVIFQGQPVYETFGEVQVELPVGAFLQATRKGQEALTRFVVEHAAGASAVADLFCGCGTYSLPLLSVVKQVVAFEGGHEMVIALHNASRKHGLEHRISAQARDLERSPLSAEELKRFDAVVLNPPRSGAKAQSMALAAGKVRRVIMVSCHPATFERDARMLLEGGYVMKEMAPIDQFYWSSHLELAALFER